jgi:hypothetical protein
MYKYTSELRADELGIKLLLCHFLRKYVLFSVIDASMISIVYGSPAAGSGNKRAASIGGLGR